MKHALAALLLIVLMPAAVTAATAGGDELAPFAIKDQHDKPGQLDETTRVLLFSRDMTANKLAKAAFMDKPATYLPDSHAMYVIDVSRMPSFVTKHFAIPKMQSYAYQVFLDRDGTVTKDLPTQAERVTIIRLDHLKVVSVDYASSATALNQAVETRAP
jgi:hypothetical protein